VNPTAPKLIQRVPSQDPTDAMSFSSHEEIKQVFSPSLKEIKDCGETPDIEDLDTFPI